MINMNQIIAAVSLATDIDVHDIVGPSRTKEVCTARGIAVFIGTKLAKLSHFDIAAAVERDRSSVTMHMERLATKMKTDPNVKVLVDEILQSIEFRAVHQDFQNIDILHVAKNVAARPYRNGMSLSNIEIAALAEGFLNVWEVALAASELADLCGVQTNLSTRAVKERNEMREALCQSIKSQLAHMRNKRG